MTPLARSCCCSAVAQLMVILDISAVNVVLPELARTSASAVVTSGWTITSYSLVFGSLLLLGGRAPICSGAAAFPRRPRRCSPSPSLVSALAGRAPRVFAARAGQGLGAAMLSPAALSIITTTFQGPDRAKALGAWGAVGGAGAAIGALLGGALTQWSTGARSS